MVAYSRSSSQLLINQGATRQLVVPHVDFAQLLQTLLNQLAISCQLNTKQPAASTSQPIEQAPLVTVYSNTQGSTEVRRSTAPYLKTRILEERPPETLAKIKAIEQVSAESKSHMKHEFPPRFNVPNFTKFSGQDETSTMEHLTRFIIQCREAGNVDAFRICVFSSSLSGLAFSWFTSMPTISIIKWSDLEQLFHNYFFYGINKMNITDQTRLKQRNNETTVVFIQRFREVRKKYYSLNLGDKQLAKQTFQDLLSTLREKYASHDFESLSQLVSQMSQETAKSFEPRMNFQKKVSYVDYSDSEDEDNMIGLAEWVIGKKTVSCPFGK
jgi:hypothetical protein